MLEVKYGVKIVFDHQASAEIQPAKAAYIETNFAVPIILRDIVEIDIQCKAGIPVSEQFL